MEGQSKEYSGKKTTIRYHRHDKPSVQSNASLQAEEENRKSEDARASIDTQTKVISDEDQTRVEKLAYGLYEQRGRKDGHDLDDWFAAERQIMIQEPSADSIKW